MNSLNPGRSITIDCNLNLLDTGSPYYSPIIAETAGLPCSECGEPLEEHIVENFLYEDDMTRRRGEVLMVPKAHVCYCPVCNEHIYDIQMVNRWRKLYSVKAAKV